MTLAPVALFVYNRPWHTLQLLNSLAANDESKKSLLYIYCDGAKEGDNEEIVVKINETRAIARNENRFKDVIVIEQYKNKGLVHSIIDGVTEVINKHDKVIVLEDDLVLSPYFLYYMNDSLTRYENNNKVGQIGACNFFACGVKYPTTFFITMPDCWGWATWKNRWKKFNSDAKQLLGQLMKNDLMYKFNAYGSYDMQSMLLAQINGIGTSWAVRWTAVCVLNDWLTLYPNPSVTNHIESNNATNANINIIPPLCMIKPNFETVEVKEIITVIKAMKRGYEGSGDFYGNFKYSFSQRLRIKQHKLLFKMVKAKSIFKALTPPILFSLIRRLKKQNNVPEIWSGDYDSWAEAKIRCTGYDSELILEKCKRALLKVKNGEAVYERDSVLFDKIQYSWGLLAGLQRAALENDGKLYVLDFGGSLGSSYYQNKGFLNSLKELQWYIVEQSHFVDCGKELFEDNTLKFYFSIEECLNISTPNVILFSGVLQYLESPYEILNSVIKYKIDLIIIDRTLFSEANKDVLKVQKINPSIFDASYPCWFLNKSRFLSLFEKDYFLVSSFVGFQEGEGFIFKKK